MDALPGPCEFAILAKRNDESKDATSAVLGRTFSVPCRRGYDHRVRLPAQPSDGSRPAIAADGQLC